MKEHSLEHTVMVAFRFVGVLTILVGLIFATQTLGPLIASHQATAALQNSYPPGFPVPKLPSQSGMFGWLILARIAIAVWGLILCALAAPLAERITTPPAPATPADGKPEAQVSGT